MCFHYFDYRRPYRLHRRLPSWTETVPLVALERHLDGPRLLQHHSLLASSNYSQSNPIHFHLLTSLVSHLQTSFQATVSIYFLIKSSVKLTQICARKRLHLLNFLPGRALQLASKLLLPVVVSRAVWIPGEKNARLIIVHLGRSFHRSLQFAKVYSIACRIELLMVMGSELRPVIQFDHRLQPCQK